MEPSTKTTKSTGPIFQDDPDVTAKLEAKLVELEKEKAYWKTVKKIVPRDYSHTPGDAKWYMPANVSARIRSVKKKLELIKARQETGVTLEQKEVFVGGKRFFKYVEVHPIEREAKQ